MKKLFENLIENSRHAEFISASQPLPEFIKLLPTFTNRVTCVKLKLLSFKSSPKSTDRATCVAPLSRSLDTLSLGEGKKCAFTLAEVLITLGIIGVVAALVMPGVINNFKCLELQTRFKKADTIIQQAMKMTLMEVGIEQYKDIQSFHSNDTETLKQAYAQINEIWAAQFKNAKKMKWVGNNFTEYKQHAGCKDFFGTPEGSLYVSCGNASGYLLPDGLFIEEISFNSLDQTDKIFFDTNGPFKGPNSFGYDPFAIYANPNDYNVSILCNPFLVHTGRVKNCYRYAQMDRNPFDSSKGYWESLYKPKSWWQKLYDNSKK